MALETSLRDTGIELPPEVWLNVLGDEELEYFDLKRLQRVNKAFNKLLAVSALLLVSFRISLTLAHSYRHPSSTPSSSVPNLPRISTTTTMSPSSIPSWNPSTL